MGVLMFLLVFGFGLSVIMIVLAALRGILPEELFIVVFCGGVLWIDYAIGGYPFSKKPAQQQIATEAIQPTAALSPTKGVQLSLQNEVLVEPVHMSTQLIQTNVGLLHLQHAVSTAGGKAKIGGLLGKRYLCFSVLIAENCHLIES